MVAFVARQRDQVKGGTCTEVLPDACRWWADAGRVGRLRGVAGVAEQRHRGPGAGWPCGVDRAPLHGLGDRRATRRLVSARHRFSHLSSPIRAPPSPTKPSRGGTSTTVLTDYRIPAATRRSTRRRESALRPSEMRRDAPPPGSEQHLVRVDYVNIDYAG